MPNLFCFGLGYSARHYLAGFGHLTDRVVGTVREPGKAAQISRSAGATRNIDVIAFDGAALVPDLGPRLAESDLALVTVPPDPDGDPVLRHYGEALARARRLEAIVYLSTVGVYGDHDGAWVDETTEPAPASQRSRVRLAAERAWMALGARIAKPVAVLRLAGIYGPDRNALLSVASGSAKRIVKPGQVFNRIHVGDIAQAIDASLAQRANGVFNVADDQPCAQSEVVAFAAALLGMAPPPEVPFEVAARTMTPRALSFYGESKRVRNDKMKRALGVPLKYPTYREGLRALFAAGDIAGWSF
jgi:dTDP-4-dehydrorhamnose reductase